MEIRLRCKKTVDGRFILGKIYTICEGRGLVDEHGFEGMPVESGSYSEWYEDCNWTDYDFEQVTNARHEIHITCTDNMCDLIESLQAQHKQAALNYQQKCRDVVELEAQLSASQRRAQDARNELCQKCGRYREAHKGACDGCRWMA